MGREIKRVPVGFDWPRKQKWPGYLNPFYVAEKCGPCGGTGYGPAARRFKDEWYGYSHFNPASTGSKPFGPGHPAIVAMATRNVCGRFDGDQYVVRPETPSDRPAIAAEARRLARDCFDSHWSHHLSQADVDALVAADRLRDLTHTYNQKDGWKPKDPPYHPTAAEVNEWSLTTFHGPDNYVCIRERCKREGEPHECDRCKGHGEIWPNEAAKWLFEAFVKIDPPEGDGWQVWETTSEGSPITPALASAEELARWCVENGASVFGGQTADYSTWLAFISEGGSAPSMVSGPGGVMSGVEFVAAGS